jgi:hypothetical protein
VLRSGEIEAAPGYRNEKGYLLIRHEGHQMLAHRRAFYLMTGECPAIIDHINRDPSDNRWSNLRAVTAQLNVHNQAARNSTGLKGVLAYNGKRGTTYRASVSIDGRCTSLGTYRTPEEAARVYDVAARLLYGDNAIVNFA